MSDKLAALERQVAELSGQVEELRLAHARSRVDLANVHRDLVTELALSTRTLGLERTSIVMIIEAVAHAMAKQASSPEAFAGALRSFVESRYGQIHRADWPALHVIGLAEDLRSEYGSARADPSEKLP